ncbi:MAG TPA: DUF3828 domain-containing protein [Xanthobacteraceae bacterium]|jgi:hypothetical protein
MIARRSVLIGASIAAAFAAAGVRAADPSAVSFVKAIYAHYQGKDANGLALESDAAVRRYFAPGLAALIIKDRRDAHGEVGKLDSDPFVDAQDWEITGLDIAVTETAADKARATVTFNSLGRAATVILDLVKLKGGWRIGEITWDGKATLTGLLTGG